MKNDPTISLVADLLAQSPDTVVLTGAGISTEAGIPDFRGKNGIYKQIGEDKVYSIINIQTFWRDPELFYAFYRKYFRLPDVPPSKAHLTLAQMEREGIIKAIVTQNVDGLHQKAGSRNVVAIHGSRSRYICTNAECDQVFSAEYVENYPQTVPRCGKCGHILKPDVVLFGEHIKDYMPAWEIIMNASALLIIGTSLTVYPLAGFVKEFSEHNKNIVIINKGPTQMDDLALYKIEAYHTGYILEEINQLIKARG